MANNLQKLRVAQGARLRKARAAAGMSLVALGAALDPPVSRQAVYRWETGQSSPTLQHQIELGAVLNVDPAKIWGFDS